MMSDKQLDCYKAFSQDMIKTLEVKGDKPRAKIVLDNYFNTLAREKAKREIFMKEEEGTAVDYL